MSAYLYNLAYEHGRVVGRLHEDILRDDFTVVEGLSAQACFSQAACIDQLEHLIKRQQSSVIPQWNNPTLSGREMQTDLFNI